MDMPGYTDYGKMYEMNPGAFWQAQDQLGLAKQFQSSRQQSQDLANERVGLDNMFQKDTYNDRVRQGKAAADLAGYQASDAGVKNRINTATEGLQLDAAQKKLLMEASESDLKKFETGAQRMAYSLDPKERAEGERLLGMHKEFIKMRTEAGIRAEEAKKQRDHQFALEKYKQEQQTARQQALAKAKLDARGAAGEKISTDQLRARYIARAEKAKAEGDYELAQELYREAEYITQMRAFERPDPMAGRVDVGAVGGLPTNPPRAVPQPPMPTQAPQPAAAPTLNFNQVKAMYPGKSDEEIRAAWKRKFGVDLK